VPAVKPSAEESPSEDPLRHIARDLNSGAIHLLRRMRETDRQSGLTPARLSALSVLVFGGPTPLGRLARVEGVSSPTMTRIVDGLAALGLAERRGHPDSSRIILVTATASGREQMESAAERRVDTIVGALVQLSGAEQEAVRAAAPVVGRLAALIGQAQRG
jgi:DNA-binding MarR family transcriptional regulator